MNRDEKLKRFANDPSLLEAVYSVLLEVYLEAGRDNDVQGKAAAQTAVHNLNDAWKKIESFKHAKIGDKNEPKGQIGL